MDSLSHLDCLQHYSDTFKSLKSSKDERSLDKLLTVSQLSVKCELGPEHVNSRCQ